MPTHALPWTLAAPASPRVFEPLLPVTRAVDWSLLWTSICPRRWPFGLMVHFIASESCMCTYISSQRRFTAQEHILSDQLAEARRLNLFMVPCSPPAAQETVTDGHVSFAQACSAVLILWKRSCRGPLGHTFSVVFSASFHSDSLDFSLFADVHLVAERVRSTRCSPSGIVYTLL